uniref:Lysozyme n=1 Tax=Steinernema glaseri TaxID=37863 RepID=A0A1I7YDT4_9BILA
MKSIICLTALLAFALAAPVQPNSVAQDGDQELAAFSYAVDLFDAATTSAFTCLRQSGYATVFLRVYKPDGSGQVDQVGIANIRSAYNANMGVEIYHTPSPQANKAGGTQFDETYTALRNAGINVRTVWLQVTSPINWGSNQQFNINLISQFLSRAKTYNVNVGIYTNWYDWSQITGSWTGWTSSQLVSLWYWNAYGATPQAESPANFQDFRAFGGWTQASVKQFGLQSNVCGLNFNRNAYQTGTYETKALAFDASKSDEITVGNVFV